MTLQETIAAIATPHGPGGIGVIRISGPGAEAIARHLFRSKKGITELKARHLYHGDVFARKTGAALDEVLICLMRKPHSYTGEDVLEIHCHGGPVILQSVLEEVLRAGARPAQPGEFTRQAFLNGRMDLSQAEAVLDMISAKTDRALSLALSQLKGELGGRITAIRSCLTDILAQLEGDIDFAEEDGLAAQTGQLLEMLQGAAGEINALLSTYREGRIVRNGLHVVIAGRANVGKSSLLNRLLGEERAIVTPIAGTTRDFIEEFINIRGIPIRLTDMAGIRDPEGPIEQEGIRRVWEKLAVADLLVLVFDGSEPLTIEDRDVIEKIGSRPAIPVINKSDLPPVVKTAEIQALMPERTPLWISAKCGDGVGELKEAIYKHILAEEHEPAETVIVSHLRHKVALEKTAFFLSEATSGLACNRSVELVACDVRDALDSLGEIVGITTAEDILERIFANFCIGK